MAAQSGADPTQQVPGATLSVPVFKPGDMDTLNGLRDNYFELLRSAELIVGEMHRVSRSLVEAVKRAEQLTRPRHVATAPTRRTIDGALTELSAGPQAVLRVLRQQWPGLMTLAQIGAVTGYSPSTVRTYLPGLVRAGLIERTLEGIGLTFAGQSTAQPQNQ